jgi:uncharacterized membrane protein HdeD (DUF308 family)
MNIKKEKQMHIMIMVLGALSLIFGFYAIITGDAVKEQIHTMVLGVSLLGVGIVYYRKLVSKNNKA